MKAVKAPNHPDVIMIYQDRDSVESAIQQIMELELEFKAYKYNPKKMHEITQMKPKVLLLSSNDVKKTIQLYIDYLEEYEQNIAPHSAVLLINNRETYSAYLACENGLFDSYVIINPLNEPHRLKLVLLQELKIVEDHKNDSLEQLISQGEDQLASCIEHGVSLKKSFQNEVKKCGENILSTTSNTLDSQEAKKILQNLIGMSVEEMNENIASGIENILEQLNELKLNNNSIKQNIENNNSQKTKTISKINTELITPDKKNNIHSKTSHYKVLIAEPSNMFSRVIEGIFSETLFKYLLVSDGQTALLQISKFKPDVVLLAYDLPTINGFEITKALREEGNAVPIIAYIHHKDMAVIKHWDSLGLSGHLIKPSKKSVILKALNEAVNTPITAIFHNKNSLMDEIQWDTKYCVGNKEMDGQHEILFTMLKDFFHQGGKQAAIISFDSLSSYINLHFESEENLLRQINYPDTDEHIKLHEELREKLDLLGGKLDDYNIDIHHKIAMFIYNWLASHILKSDMKYKSYALLIDEESFSSSAL